MKYNHSANRQRFENEQLRQAKRYRDLGMSEEAIQTMYLYDLSVFNSTRRNIEHKATIEEMTSFDPVTGESHYKDMDEYPGKESRLPYSYRMREWLEEIEDKKLYRALCSFSDDYIAILSMKMDGFTDEDISEKFNVKRKTINKKVLRIKKLLKIFI